jgi:aryl-alcohol dehydrogenase-like predicted oxidoreductase
MKLRTLGRSGLKVSVIGLGLNNLGERIDDDAAKDVVHTALDAGVNFFDTADHYGKQGGSERLIGKLLGERRKDVILATKFGLQMDEKGWLYGTSRRYVMSAVEASLKRLNTDYIDLYYLHRPDGVTPIEETLRALDDIIKQGKVRYIACSNVPAWGVVEAHWTAKTNNLNPFIAAQDELSLVVRDAEKELMPALESCGMGLVPYFPLASGLLTGKFKRGVPPPADTRMAKIPRFADKYMTDKNMVIAERLQAWAEGRGKTLADLSFAWLLAKRPVASVIAGASRGAQIKTNAKSAEWELTPAEVAEVDKIAAGNA